MGKKRKTPKPKDIPSGLCPARKTNQIPDIPFKIKTEPGASSPLNSNQEDDIDALLRAARQNAEILLPTDSVVAAEGDDNSSCSATSTDTVFNEVSERLAAVTDDTEPVEPAVIDTDNASLESQSYRDENEALKTKLNTENSDLPELQNYRAENVTAPRKLDIDNNDSPELKNNQNVSMMTKRKLNEKAVQDLEEKLEILRKRCKVEPVPMNEDNQDTLIPVIETDQDPPISTNDNLQAEICHEDMDITVLPVAKKTTEMLTLSDSDDDDDDQSASTSTINLPKKAAINRNFSIDTLKYFNVVSELDRYDCKSCLDHLSNYETKNTAQKLFPVIKKERKNKVKIQKGDILFRGITNTDTDTENKSISPLQPQLSETASNHVNCNDQYADLPVTACDNFSVALTPPAPQLESFSSLKPHSFDSLPESQLQNVQPVSQFNFNSLPLTSQTAMTFPNIPNAHERHFSVNVPQNSQVKAISSASNLSTGIGSYNCPIPSTSKGAVTFPNLPIADERHFGVNGPQNSRVEAISSASNLSRRIGSYNHPIPSTSRGAMTFPNTPIADERQFGVNVAQNSQVEAKSSASNFSTGIGSYNYPVPSTSRGAMNFPNMPITDERHFRVNVTQNSQVEAISSASNFSAGIGSYNNPIPSTSRGAMTFPNIPITDERHFGVNMPQNSQIEAITSVSNLSTLIDSWDISLLHEVLAKTLSSDVSLADPLPEACDQNRTFPVHNPHESTHDPRLRKKRRLEDGSSNTPAPSYSHVPVSAEFPNRKGKKDLLLFHNVGRDDVTQHFYLLILQWNPAWLEMQRISGHWPPICITYPRVAYSYRNEMDYYNTYVPLLMLHIWYDIYKCWENKTYPIVERCRVLSVDISDADIKITCFIELDESDVWPKRDDILYCRYHGEEAFLRVSAVSQKSINSSTFKLRIELVSVHDFILKAGDTINFIILYNVSTAYLQMGALNSLDSAIKELILKPENHANSIVIQELDTTQQIKEQRDSILKAPSFAEIPVVAIKIEGESYPVSKKISLLRHLTYSIAHAPSRRQPKVLVFMKSAELLKALYSQLRPNNPVLAVRTKQVKLEDELLRETLEYRLERREILYDILSNHDIFLTTYSAFSKAEKTHLSKLKNLYCILDDAHLCTEVETALPLTLKIKKLLLFGNKGERLQLPDLLQERRYYITLFERLLNAKHVR